MALVAWSLVVQDHPLQAQDEHKKAPEKKVEKIRKLAAECRNLEFLRPVEVRVMDMESLRKKVMEMFETEVPPETLAAYEKAYKAFRLLPSDMSIREVLIDLYSEQIGGFYDPRTKELYVIDRSGPMPDKIQDINEILGKMMEGLIGMSQDEMVMLHELVHALQDQHFNLLTIPSDNTDNDDLGIASKALIEGDATYAMFEPVAKRIGFNPFDMGGKKMMGGANLGGTVGQLPEVIQQSLIFPYVAGAKFVAKLRREGKLEAVNAAFDDLPASTEQILHPDKYFSERDNPTTVNLPDLTKQTLPGWKLLLANVLGELNVGVLLRANWPKMKNTNKIAAGWDGDRFAYLESADGGNFVLAWYTTWDSRKEATEFWISYGKVLKEKKYPQHSSLGEGSGLAFLTPDSGKGVLVHLEMRENDVLAVEGNVSENVLKEIVAALWNGTTKKELTKVERVEPPAVPEVAGKGEKKPAAEEAAHALQVETPDLSITAKGLKLTWTFTARQNCVRLTTADDQAAIDIRMASSPAAAGSVKAELDSLMAKCRKMLSPATFGEPAALKHEAMRGRKVEFKGVADSRKELRGCLAAVTCKETKGKFATVSLLCSPQHFGRAMTDFDAVVAGLRLK